jgi:hypothetical protein
LELLIKSIRTAITLLNFFSSLITAGSQKEYGIKTVSEGNKNNNFITEKAGKY